LVGLEALGIERVVVSPLPLGRGFIRGAHGQIPLPAPATVALLRGAPVVGSEIEKELVTPTGAVLLTSLAESFGPIPAMTLTAVSYGAGGWDLPIPNVLRLLLGEAAAAAGVLPSGTEVETLLMLETNVDDLNPEIYGYVMERLFQAGALDVFLSDIQMKKNRPATMIHVLCRLDGAGALSAILFAETSTLGVRQQLVTRQALPREIRTVETPYGPVRIKIAWWEAGRAKSSPEYEDCRRLAEQQHVPLREVYRAAARAADEYQAAQKGP
jgi:pyridinium-3,5-bisthiocarboxylic acid mononucleotide nickel chelatase